MTIEIENENVEVLVNCDESIEMTSQQGMQLLAVRRIPGGTWMGFNDEGVTVAHEPTRYGTLLDAMVSVFRSTSFADICNLCGGVLK
jgi:hypothetical protein